MCKSILGMNGFIAVVEVLLKPFDQSHKYAAAFNVVVCIPLKAFEQGGIFGVAHQEKK